MSLLTELHTAACQAREKAYSPYSKYKVGSAVKISTGEIFGGCNVENASYGGTVCAERVAIFSAVARHGAVKVDDIFVVTDETQGWPPCGFCRQVIAEFSHDNTMVHIGNLNGLQRSVKFDELLPEAFKPSHLGQG